MVLFPLLHSGECGSEWRVISFDFKFPQSVLDVILCLSLLQKEFPSLGWQNFFSFGLIVFKYDFFFPFKVKAEFAFTRLCRVLF